MWQEGQEAVYVFEKDQGEVHERFWRGRKEGRNDVILL